MALFSFSLFNIPGLTAALYAMDLLYLLRSAATALITRHSRAATASARRMPAHATLTRLSTAALRLALLFALPFTLLILVLLRLSASLLSRRRRQPATGRQTILLTTNSARSNTCALSLARALHARGHYAVAVAHALPDPPSRRFPLSLLLNPSSLLPPATSFSAAVASAHRLHIPAAPLRVRHADPDDDSASSLYEHEVLGVILRLRPSVWVPCELLVDGGGGGDAALREAVGLLRETLGREAERGRPRGKRWVLEARESDVAGEVQRVELPVGDGDSLNETYECLARLDVSDARPWVMREVVEVEGEGGEAYRAHAVVLNGAVRAFAASRAADAADETAGRLFLEPSSPLHVSIHAFVDAFVAALPGHPSAPLALDITVRTSPTPTGTATSIHPTRCSWTLPPLAAPPFSTAIASLVSSIASSSSSSSPPPPPPGQKRPTSTDEAVPAQNGRLPPDLHTPPTSPVLNPLVTRFVASTLPPTPPGSPDSRRSRSVDTSPPRQHHHSKKREFAPLPLPQTPSTPPPPAPLGWSSRPGSSGSSIGGGGGDGSSNSHSSNSSTHLELIVAVAPKQKQKLADVPTSTPPPPAKRRAADDAVTDKVSSSSADLVYGVAGTYSLPRTLRAYVLLPLLELLLLRRPVRRGVVAVVQGWAVVVERVLLPGQGINRMIDK
ncbi:hypothetical protein UCDDS831_g09275 [Diplodia seriata]|uniref:Uncharacterized protein n=1 Tax=Diplodia seriata TaxID=420778 RepID=A0A0G2G7H4_9PEZI|nr:hypothetical protein UCDDS831_g09275 [Diplodia seriata]